MENNVLAKTYEPKEVEEKWYHYWENSGLFKADIKAGKPSFCIVMTKSADAL